MMKKINAVILLSAVFCFSQEAAHSLELVNEDFEDAAYVIDGPIAAGGLFEVTLGPQGVTTSAANVVATNIATGGTKSGGVIDTSSSDGASVTLTTPQILGLNGDTGIQKGSVQFDYTFGASNLYAEINLLDDLDLSDTSLFTIANEAGHVRLIASSQTLNARFLGDANAPASEATVAGTTYRFKFTFDNSTKDITIVISKNAPAFDQEIMNLTGKFRSSDAAFKGVRYLAFTSNSTNTATHQFDNIIITDDNAVAGPEIQVEDGTTNIPDNTGTVDFGAPDVGAAAPSKTFTVSNIGTQTLTLGAVTVPSNYTVTTALPATLAAGADAPLVVEVGTATGGIYDGEISIVNDDADENPFNFNVTANIGRTAVENWHER